MRWVDDILNHLTMYRLVLYYLCVIFVVALVEGVLPLPPGYALNISSLNLLFSTAVILAVCYGANTLFARVFRAIANVESVYITAFILAFLITPVAPTDAAGIGYLIFASLAAMASKYVFAIGKKHIFNPAAFGIAAAALVINQSASWWVGGNLALLPVVLIGGLMIVRKLRHADLVIAFTLVSLITMAVMTHGSPLVAAWNTIIHTSLIFLGLVMLTEPLTMPPTRRDRIIYGALVGLLFAPAFHVGSYYFTPEIALLIGNIYVYIVSPKGRYMLSLVAKTLIADGTYEFVFKPDRRFIFEAGQYVEWTLALAKSDGRGNRRFFTIASAPTEEDGMVRLGVKMYEPASSFKRALLAMAPGDTISVSQLGGEFTLPKDTSKKLVFIAGGIGVTPFRSHVQYLIDTRDTRDVTLLYSNKTAAEIAYRDVFDHALKTIGLKTVYTLTNETKPVPGTYQGMIDAQLIKREVPDISNALFYISGPQGMVTAFKKTLTDMGVSRLSIKTDYFPGFA